MPKISDMPIDTNVSGVEKFPVSDGTIPKHITTALIKDYTIDEIEAIAQGSSASLTDGVYILQGGELKPVDLSAVTALATNEVWSKLAETDADDADVMALKDGSTEKTITLSVLWNWIRTHVLGIKLDDLSTPDDNTDLDATTSLHGLMSKVDKTKLDGIESGATADQTGAEIKVAYENESNTNAYTDAEKLKLAGIQPGAGDWDGDIADIDLDGGTDIGADLVDADLILVDDGATGTNRKSAISRIWTYIQTKLAGLTGKTTPIGADGLILKDSEDSNSHKELTLSNLSSFIQSTLESTFYDISGLDTLDPISPSDLFLVTSGSTGKKFTFGELSDTILGALDDYIVNDLGDAPIVNDDDLIYVLQSGIAHKMTLSQIMAHLGTSLSGSGTSNFLAQWYDYDTLKAGPSLATSFSVGDDNSVPTSKAVRDEMNTVIQDASDYPTGMFGVVMIDEDEVLVRKASNNTQYSCTLNRLKTIVYDVKLDNLSEPDDNTHLDATTARHGLMSKADKTKLDGISGYGDIADIDLDGGTDIGADLVDADLILVDDGATGTNRKSAISRIWTYIQSKLAGYKLDDLAEPDDNTDLDATTARHGLLPKLNGVSTDYLGGDGDYHPAVGDGDVHGPSSSTDEHIAVFNGASGKQIKDGGISKDTIDSNTTHRTGDGSDHSAVVNNTSNISLNTTHRTSDGSDHSLVLANSTDRHAELHALSSHNDLNSDTGSFLDGTGTLQKVRLTEDKTINILPGWNAAIIQYYIDELPKDLGGCYVELKFDAGTWNTTALSQSIVFEDFYNGLISLEGNTKQTGLSTSQDSILQFADSTDLFFENCSATINISSLNIQGISSPLQFRNCNAKKNDIFYCYLVDNSTTYINFGLTFINSTVMLKSNYYKGFGYYCNSIHSNIYIKDCDYNINKPDYEFSATKGSIVCIDEDTTLPSVMGHYYADASSIVQRKQFIIKDASSADQTHTLDAISTTNDGRVVRIGKTGAYKLTLSPASGDTIDAGATGEAISTLDEEDSFITLRADNTNSNWQVISKTNNWKFATSRQYNLTSQNILTGDLTISLTASMSASDINALIESVPKNLGGHKLIINCADGTYTLSESIVFADFYNYESIELNGNSSDIGTTKNVYFDFGNTSNSLRLLRLPHEIIVRYIKIRSNTSTIYCYQCPTICDVKYCYFLGYSDTAHGVYFYYCRSHIQHCYCDNLNRAIVSNNSFVRSTSNNENGTTPKYGLYGDSGLIFKVGAQPAGSTADEIKYNGAQIW
jgi:hypothetical protein